MDGTEAGSAATASPYGGRGEETSLKDKGNEFFKRGNYLKDAALYTLAIKQDSSNPTLYSNRDAAFLQLAKLNKALADAETTVTLKPQWEKLYFRKECILEAMERYDDVHLQALASFKWLCNITHRVKKYQEIKKIHQLARDIKRAQEVVNMSPLLQSGKYGSEESWKEMLSFLVETMETAVKSCHENSNVDARVYFLLDNEKTQTEKYAPVVNIDKAFESPHTHGSCFAFLRQYAEDSFSTAACLVAQKSIISYPQVWKGHGSRNWKHGLNDGFFVQFELPYL